MPDFLTLFLMPDLLVRPYLLWAMYIFLIIQIMETGKQIAEKTEIYVPYNILPLDPDSVNQAIMLLPEVCS